MKRAGIFAVVLFLTGCSGNALYYDPDEQALKPERFSRLSKFSITNLSDSTDCGYSCLYGQADRFYLFKPNPAYEPFECSSDFTITPGNRYLIINKSVGDAATWRIIVEIDRNKRVNLITPDSDG